MEQLRSIKICNYGSFSGNILSEYSLYLKYNNIYSFAIILQYECLLLAECLDLITRVAIYTCRIQTALFEMEVACGAAVEAVEWPGIDGTVHC